MATALVVRAQRYKKIGDKTSPLVYILKRKPRDAKMYDLKRISEEIEALGGMSAEDVLHVGKAIVRNMREKLTDGNRSQEISYLYDLHQYNNQQTYVRVYVPVSARYLWHAAKKQTEHSHPHN